MTTPKPPKLSDNLQKLLDSSNEKLESCTSCTDTESAQNFARDLDKLLKELSELQTQLGEIRRSMTKHISSLRVASPKAKASGPVELKVGSAYLINGIPNRWDGTKFNPIQE